MADQNDSKKSREIQSKNGESLIPFLKELLADNDSSNGSREMRRKKYDKMNENGEKMSYERVAAPNSTHGSISVEDSGTESGEDLRLLAAGLETKIEQNGSAGGNVTCLSNSSGLLDDVQQALGRLRVSLETGTANGCSEAALTSKNFRSANLLSLVKKLQDTLGKMQSRIDDGAQKTGPMAGRRYRRSNTLDLAELKKSRSIVPTDPAAFNGNSAEFFTLPTSVIDVQNSEQNRPQQLPAAPSVDASDKNHRPHQQQHYHHHHHHHHNHHHHRHHRNYYYRSQQDEQTKDRPVETFKNWNRIFDTIKTTFETRSAAANSAKTFWKSTETHRNDHGSENGSLQSPDTNPKPKYPWMNKFGTNTTALPSSTANRTARNVIRIEAPKVITQFSHAPLSAFKPPIKRAQTQIVSLDDFQLRQRNATTAANNRLFLYAPKKESQPQSQPSHASTSSDLPKTANGNEPEYTATSKIMARPQGFHAVPVQPASRNRLHLTKSESCHEFEAKKNDSSTEPNNTNQPPLNFNKFNSFANYRQRTECGEKHASKEQFLLKRRNIESYFCADRKSKCDEQSVCETSGTIAATTPTPISANANANTNAISTAVASSSAIKRMKTSDKIAGSTNRKSSQILRSNTMPEVAEMKYSQLLDDSLENVETAFEDLFSSSVLHHN